MIFDGLVQLDVGEMYCKILGNNLFDGKPIIIVFPGGPGLSHEIYEAHSSCFASFANMVFFDPIGTGQSSLAESIAHYTLDNYVMNAYALLNYFNIKKVIILGISYGSMCALNFARLYPNVAEKLILVGGAPSYEFLAEAKKLLEAKGNEAQKMVGEKLFAGDFKSQDDISNFFTVMSTLYSLKAKREGISPYKTICSLEPLNQAFRTEFEMFDYRNILPTITANTLILVGAEDWINPPSQAQITASLLPNARLCVIEESGHSIAVDQPYVYRNLINDFANFSLNQT